MSLTDNAADLETQLNDLFGLEEFRPGQREVIEHVLQGRDVLCVMPTGGGKSLCYQLPAVLLPGLTLVISPLIALMKDQVDALTQRGLRATLINSTLDPSEQRARMLEIEAGLYDLVYVAPERFRSGRFVETVARLKPALIAVDEAHCISQWGHDFRPDYARIGIARRALGSPPCIALTATATDLVRRDIAVQLDLRDPALFVTGFDRPNLTYGVVEARRDSEKLAALSKTLDEARGAAIVYASSRLRCEEVAAYLRKELRREAVVYHAGLTREDRTSAQERFMAGDAEIVVATNAFGMGVDKPDIRAVVHYNMPGTLEAYYQEAGRAGRDGQPARCVLLYAPGDRVLQERFIDNEYPPPEVVFQVYEFLRRLDADPIELTQSEIKAETRIALGESAVGTALKLLEGAGVIERFLPRENMAILRINAENYGPESFVDLISPQAHVQRLVLLGIEGLVNRRYAEPVYFQPDDLAASLGLERVALSRALRAIAAELPIDYVPPFRGNAIRMIDRKRRARDIEIDFARLEKRKQGEYDKLERIVNYCRTPTCRRAFLLGYFGDERPDRLHCGRCDNCGGDPDQPTVRAVSEVNTPAGREVILKVLSGVARTKGRVGKTVIAQMLKGSGSERMEKLGLRRLTTFGILPDFALPELTQLIDALASAGYVECPEVDRFRPVVQLSESGWELLKVQNLRSIFLPLPDELAGKICRGGLDRLTTSRNSSVAASESDAEPGEGGVGAMEGDPLFERLKALRAELAREARQPAYCVMTNQTLEALARYRPTTPQALGQIKGLGPARLERYGSALLDTITGSPPPDEPATPIIAAEAPPAPLPSRLFTSDALPPLKSPAPNPVLRHATTSSYVATEEWTWRLLDRGFTIDDAAAIRGLDRTTVLRHATLAARQGKVVPPHSYLGPETSVTWEAWREQNGETQPPPEILGEGGTELWALFVAGSHSD